LKESANERPANPAGNRPVAAPRFASEIAEEQAQQASSAGRQGSAISTAAHGTTSAEADSPVLQARQDVAPASPSASQPGNAVERAPSPVHPARVAELEDQQLDVPAYLRRNDL
jgi:hypothetical protein